MARWKAKTFLRQRSHRKWHLPVCWWSSWDENLRTGHFSVIQCFVSFHKHTSGWNNRNPRGEKLSETMGLTRNMTVTSQKPTLWSCERLLRRASFFDSKKICTNTRTGLLWALPSGQMHLCAISKNNWQTKTRCLLPTTVMSTTPSEKWAMFHRPLKSCQHWMKCTPRSVLQWDSKTMANFLGMVIIKKWSPTRHKDNVKPTDTGPLLHY